MMPSRSPSARRTIRPSHGTGPAWRESAFDRALLDDDAPFPSKDFPCGWSGPALQGLPPDAAMRYSPPAAKGKGVAAMGISLDAMEYAGCWEACITELASFKDHAVLFAHVEALIREARITALLIDARKAEIPQQRSFSRAMWDDGMAVLRVIPICYMPPHSNDTARWAMIREAVAEWEADVTFLGDREAALDWCRRHARPAAGTPA